MDIPYFGDGNDANRIKYKETPHFFKRCPQRVTNIKLVEILEDYVTNGIFLKVGPVTWLVYFHCSKLNMCLNKGNYSSFIYQQDNNVGVGIRSGNNWGNREKKV